MVVILGIGAVSKKPYYFYTYKAMKGISLVKLNRTYAIRLSTDLGRVKTILTLATIPFYIVPLK